MTDILQDDDELFVRAARRAQVLDDGQLSYARDLQARMRDLGLVPKPISLILRETGVLEEAVWRDLARQVQRIKDSFRVPGYKLLERLGHGSMGTVFKARRLSDDVIVAVKILSPRLTTDEAYVRRFDKEWEAVRRLDHPNVVRGVDAGVGNGLRYFAMEYCEGPTLLQLVRDHGPLDDARALDLVSQVADALDHAHQQGLVHRDIKPDNMILMPDDVVKLCDLGLAKDDTGGGGATTGGATVGTPNYISPEQVRGDANIDIRSDLYSLGATLYHLVTGVPPFDGINPTVILVKHINEEPVAPRLRRASIGRGTEQIILRLLAKDPAHRPQSPGELLDMLDVVRAGGELPDDPATAPPRRRRRGRGVFLRRRR